MRYSLLFSFLTVFVVALGCDSGTSSVVGESEVDEMEQMQQMMEGYETEQSELVEGDSNQRG